MHGFLTVAAAVGLFALGVFGCTDPQPSANANRDAQVASADSGAGDAAANEAGPYSPEDEPRVPAPADCGDCMGRAETYVQGLRALLTPQELPAPACQISPSGKTSRCNCGLLDGAFADCEHLSPRSGLCLSNVKLANCAAEGAQADAWCATGCAGIRTIYDTEAQHAFSAELLTTACDYTDHCVAGVEMDGECREVTFLEDAEVPFVAIPISGLCGYPVCPLRRKCALSSRDYTAP